MPKVKYEEVNVLDENGNIVGTQRYPEGGSLYKEAKKAREEGGSYSVYQSGRPEEEVYTPVSEAKATTTIDPLTGTITVDGPDWLTSEIVNSDTFKKNYSENKALLGLVNMYRSDPSSTIADPTTGNPISVADALRTFQDSANDYAGSYATIKSFKDDVSSKYGTNFTDEEVAIANTFYNKDDYNKSGAVYIPDWAMDKYDWSSVGSWNADNKTISAEDFYNTVYAQDFDNNTAKKLQDEALKRMQGYLDYNVYDPSDEEEATTRQDNMANGEYASELARTMHMYNLVTQNSPETSALYDMAMFGASSVTNFIGAAANAGYNISSALVESFEGIADFALDTIGVDDESRTGIGLLMFANPAYLGSYIVGETINAIQNGGDIKEIVTELQEDTMAMYRGHLGEQFEQHRDELNSLFDDFNAELQSLSGAAAAGEMFGNLAWKIAENIVFLNVAGGAIETGISALGTGSGIATFMGKAMSAKSVVKIFKLLGFSANITAQGLLETMIDDKQLLEKAISTGEAGELMDKITSNIWWNFIGEGATKGTNWVLTQTTSGKVVSMGLSRVTGGVEYAKGTILEKVFLKLNRIKADGSNIAEVAGGSAEAAGRSVEAFNIATGYHGANALRRLLLQNPILSEASETFDDMVSRIAKLLDPEGVLSPEETADLSKQVAEMVDTSTEDGTSIAKSAGLENGKPLRDIIDDNYERYQKIIAARANLEYQIDSISKGVSMKMTQINNEINGDGTVDAYAKSENELASVESRVRSAGGELTIRESGSLLSKEASEAISLKSQAGHYRWQIDSDTLAPARKVKTEAYLAEIEAKIAGYEAKYGAEWTDAINDYWQKLGKYNKAMTDYLIKHGYVDKEYADMIEELRKQGYGDDGSLYIPTARLFGKESIETGVNRFAKENFSDKVALFRTRKVIGDDPLYLKPGNIEDSFIDPTMVFYSKFRAAATVAQAQDLGRAVQAANIATRALKGFSNEGFSEYEVSLMEKGLSGLRKELNDVLSAKGDSFNSIVKNAFNSSDVFKYAFDQKKLVGRLEAAQKSAGSAETAYKTAVRKEMTVGTQRGIISTSTDAELSNILSVASDSMAVPSFDIMSLRAADFNSWYESLPKKLQDTIKDALNGQNLNVTNVKNLARKSNLIRDLKAEFINDKENIKVLRKTQEFQDFTLQKRMAELDAQGKTVLSAPRQKYVDAMQKVADMEKELGGAVKWDASDIKTLGDDFQKTVEDISGHVIEEMRAKLSGSRAFKDLAQRVFDNSKGVFESLDDAERYVVLNQLRNIKASKFAAPLNESIGNAQSIAMKNAAKSGGKKQALLYSKELANSIGDGVRGSLDSQYNELVNLLKAKNATDAIDMKSYWDDIEKEMSEIEERGLFTPKDGSRFVRANPRKVIQLIDSDGKLKYYEADPMFAFAANGEINFHSVTNDAIANAILGINAQTSQIFRWGTTGIDLASYVNQWFRDSMDAVMLGGALPFTNLKVGSAKALGASIITDSVPFGRMVFGSSVTDTITNNLIDATYESTRRGLIAENGQEWWDNFAAYVTRNATEENAEQVLRRATVEFSAGSLGADSIPGMGGITEAQLYRAGSGEPTTLKEVRRERMDIALGKQSGLGMDSSELGVFRQAQSKMQQKIDDFFEYSSRGAWRESFARRSVYTTQYKNALEAGMSLPEARVWATRYALDATTDFGRTFAYANRFIKSVPYLGAAINGHKSFFRLLEIDAAGVASRFTYGLILPYMTLLTESLSDPRNREVYKTIKEYEKQDSAFLVYKGAKVQIPLPQQLSRFLAPFRQAVEKAADAQDASWNDLIASDILGIFPVDLSGFVGLDANDILMDDDETGLGTRIGRGVEKAASSLMPPAVKSMYMLKFGRDPYTGRDIDTSYVYLDENGDEQIMDNTKSEIAKGFAEFSKKFGLNLSASASLKVLQSLFGRSTISVLDNAKSLFSGDIKSFNESLAEQVTNPVDGGSDYDEARSNWNSAINQAYAMREQLINDDALQKAIAIMNDENYSEERREGARQTYNSKMDEFSKYVLDIANNMKEKYPEQYTEVRVAQIVSLLTMPTGIGYNDTDYARELQKDSYYDSRNHAISTLINMGFPLETSDNSLLGHGHYDKYGEYQFKVYTPYEIQYMQSAKYGNTDQIQAMVKKALDDAEITSSKMWQTYYSANGKAARKQVSNEWNAGVVKTLYPIISRYGANSVLSDSATRDMLEDYLLISNPYKKKQYMYQIFGGEQ